jgi:hypothetical protein
MRSDMTVAPQWTDTVEKRGLDPLGMQNAGVNLYQKLLPGISNVTLRVRYYGFYCWLSDTYARNEPGTDAKTWQTWVRRGEALYALVAAMSGNEAGVGGIEWAVGQLAMSGTTINFSEAAATGDGERRYLRQSMGVFGGAYYSQMVELQLFQPEGQNHTIPKASQYSGVALANLFRKEIGQELEILLVAAIKTAEISRTDLVRLAPVSPSMITDASGERQFYQDVLFAKRTEPSESDISRSQTLMLLLSTAQALGQHPSPDQVRWHLFEPPNGEQSSQLEPQRLKWEAYQAQDLFQLAAAGILNVPLVMMAGSVSGLSYDEVESRMHEFLLEAVPDFGHLTWCDYQDSISGEGPKFEHHAATIASKRSSHLDRLRSSVHLIAALHQRILQRRDLAKEIDRSFPLHGNARSIRSELQWIGHRESLPVGRLIAEYTKDRVIRRHNWVAMRKLKSQRDYTFLFEARDGRLVRRADYVPVPTTPRLAPTLQFLTDIKLLDAKGTTDKGRNILVSQT